MTGRCSCCHTYQLDLVLVVLVLVLVLGASLADGDGDGDGNGDSDSTWTYYMYAQEVLAEASRIEVTLWRIYASRQSTVLYSIPSLVGGLALMLLVIQLDWICIAGCLARRSSLEPVDSRRISYAASIDRFHIILPGSGSDSRIILLPQTFLIATDLIKYLEIQLYSTTIREMDFQLVEGHPGIDKKELITSRQRQRQKQRVLAGGLPEHRRVRE
ncbi:hypothetical protein KQX54_019313 [Cotesia glomerata]|uniref:Uncharacterized protein n=1 Tax=Cotesia glomerata TaxID=32391 RepID=A0AAV7HG93_COTGL|nr:hypothetical protein KQX54_019313 [Cotesia glomerata]